MDAQITISAQWLCPLCGATRYARNTLAEHVSIHVCSSCGVGTTEPKSVVCHPDYSNFPQWSKTVTENETEFRRYPRALLAYLRKHLKAGKLLDVGCSVGLLVDEARILGFDSNGIDLDERAVTYGQERKRRVHASSLENWPTFDYDVICLSHTLEHIDRPKEFLAECIRHLNPGGFLVIAVPCHAGLLPRVFPRWWYGWVEKQHYFHYSAKSLHLLFANCQLESVEVFQDSMDHKLGISYIRRWQDLVKGIAVCSTARMGAMFGMGDQLIGIGRVATTL